MLYYLFEFLEQQYQLPGASLFQFQTFRAGMAVLFSLLIAMIYGKRIIEFLQRKQIGESVRDLGLEGQKEKAGTPTICLLYTSPSPRDRTRSRMPSSA